MGRKTSVIFFIFFIFLNINLISEDKDDSTIEEDRRRIIKYGIDSQLLDLLSQIKSENDASYNNDLLEILTSTKNTKIQESIISLYIKTEEKAGFPWAKEKLKTVIEDDLYNTDMIKNLIGYLGELKDNESADLFFQMIEKKDEELNETLLRNLRKLETDHDASFLLALLEERDYEDNKDTLTPELILTLGTLKYSLAAPVLEEILQNEDSSSLNRSYSCIALGQIGDAASLNTLEDIYYNSEDSILRSYALSGLGYYDSEEVLPILMEALRRDSYWKVRESAANSLKDIKAEEAIELLLYKAEYDPVRQVQKASINALASFQTKSNNEFLVSYIADDKRPEEMRLFVLDILLEKKIPSTVESLNSIFDTYWDKKSSRFLEFCAKKLSSTQWKDLSPLYKRLLNHSYYINQIYAIRGIRINKLSSLYSEAAGLDRDGQHNAVRREAKTFSKQKKEDSDESSQ